MKISLLIISLLIAMSGYTQEKNIPKYYFGYSLVENSSGELVSCGIIRVSPSGKTKITPLTTINFFLQVAGEQTSVANPERINLWKELKIDARTVYKLWKLKYSEYPYQRSDDTEGWANLKYSASRSQLQFLKKYGFKKSITDFIFGEKSFQLLNDIQNPDWQYEYSTL